jgi:hypothetical protein
MYIELNWNAGIFPVQFASMHRTAAVAVFLVVFSMSSYAIDRLAIVESSYADYNDAVAAISTIDSGYAKTYNERNREQWKTLLSRARHNLTEELNRIDKKQLSAADARAVDLIRTSLASPSDVETSKSHCADAKTATLQYRDLRQALYSCFSEVGDHLSLDGREMTRGEGFGKLEQLTSNENRKAVFLAIAPLYQAINGDNESDSPYRRLIKMASQQKSSELQNAAKTLGVSAIDVERWLVEILDKWRSVAPDHEIEPWDYRFDNGEASRTLDAAVSRDLVVSANERYYRDLGADLRKLGVIEDIDPRPGKSPVAYTDFARRGRMVNGQWEPTIARVLATYPNGGLGNLNEYVHENGHAVQISAIHTRPAFMDWGDTLFVEAFADVTSWNTYDEAWQQKYLGRSAPRSENLRNLYGGVILDVAWALFEIRMLNAPDGDPNVVWSDITNRYLHIKKHPELSWWAVRGQLVDAPGYMVNYGLGAVLTADLRAGIASKIGPFVTGNPQWYPWLTQHLLRFGTERNTSDLLRSFLGRPVSPRALIDSLANIKTSTAGKP